MTPEEYELLKHKINQLIRIDLEYYRPNQMIRRLDGFISRRRIDSVEQFCALIEKDPRELAELQDFLTINVSEFFRDVQYFTFLEETVLPLLLKNHRALNVWSAGCSNGSEAFSVAMILENIAPTGGHRIIASDIDDGSLNRGISGGPYYAADVKNVPAKYLSRYFVRKDDTEYRVADEIRKRVRFKKHDLLKDAYEHDFDLIICRNVVIYFSEEAKQKLKNGFYKSLKPGGVLFIGATESMLDAHSFGFEKMHPSFYLKPALSFEKVLTLQPV